MTPAAPSRNLDVLRGIAILCVLAVHLVPSLPRQVGTFGVLIFFVHTSLVLMMSLERLQSEQGWPRRFYVRRAFRIYPLSILCVVVVVVCRIPDSAGDEIFQAPSLHKLVANLLLTQNFVFGEPSVSSPLWSLPFEIQMYLLLPLIFWLLRRNGIRAVGVMLVAAVVIAWGEALVFPNERGPGIFRYLPCFMGGVLAYARRNKQAVLSFWVWPILIGLTGCAYCAAGPFLEWPVCVAIGYAVPLFRECPKGVISRSAGLLAQYSYGIYLSHLPLIWLCFVRWHAPAAVRWAVFLLLLGSVPPLLFHLLEHPMIQVGKRLSAYLPVTAPSEADDTSVQYLAKTPTL